MQPTPPLPGTLSCADPDSNSTAKWVRRMRLRGALARPPLEPGEELVVAQGAEAGGRVDGAAMAETGSTSPSASPGRLSSSELELRVMATIAEKAEARKKKAGGGRNKIAAASAFRAPTINT